MKKVFLIGCFIVIFLLSGCIWEDSYNTITLEENSQSSAVPISEEETSQTQKQSAELNLDYLDKVSTIEVSDYIEGEFTEEMSIMLTEEEVSALKAIKDCIKWHPQAWKVEENRYYKCKMNLYDQEGNLITCWRCDFHFVITDDAGQILELEDEIGDWFKAVTKTHDLFAAKYNRMPGENYFAELKYADSGNGEEDYLPNGSNDYIRFYLDEEDLSTLREIADNIYVTEGPRMAIVDMNRKYDNLKYNVNIYTDTEASYYFYVTDDGKIYTQTDYCYELAGEGVQEWFRALETKYGLDKI